MAFFKKLCASGNNFIIIDERKETQNWSGSVIQRLCDRKFGVGADQLLIIRSSRHADASMVVYNADGTKAEQCGNGLRAIAAFLLKGNDFGLTKLKIQSGPSCVHEAKMLNEDIFMVQMGWPILIQKDLSFVNAYEGLSSPLYVQIGNPHLVLWAEYLADINLDHVGQGAQKYFPEGVNVHVVQKISSSEVRLYHWERGVGATLSCGSGTVAAIFAGHHLGKLDQDVLVRTRQEDLFVECKKEGYALTGRVDMIFDGCLRIKT